MQVKQHPDVIRFEAKVDKAGPVSPILGSPCWPWTGATDARGYPKFWLRGNSVTAQRAALILAGVDLQPDQQAVNVCGNRLCVRREHLAVASLGEAHALRHRGRPRIGPGELALMRLVVRDGEVPVEYVANAYHLSPEFVKEVASAG